MAIVPVIVLLAYLSLALELTVLHVPSVASTSKIWSRPPMVEAAYSSSYGGVFSLSRPKKLVLFVLPLLAVFGVFIYPLVAIWGPPEPLGDHAFTTTAITDAVAVSFIVVGRVVTLGSVVTIRRGGGESTALYTEGLFRLSRNPGLVGMYVFVGGLWVAAPSLAMLGGFVVYVVHMHIKVRMEEDYLESRFEESYRVYRQRTSRYLP